VHPASSEPPVCCTKPTRRPPHGPSKSPAIQTVISATVVFAGDEDEASTSSSTSGSDDETGSSSDEDQQEDEDGGDATGAAELPAEAHASGMLVDSKGRSIRAMASLSLSERYPVQSKQQLLASYGLGQQEQQAGRGKQRSAVRGADGGKMRPGEPL
jgi:hypothetical protein